MAENSNIEWTKHTFNPWRGCTKVSKECDLCYAATLSLRNPKTLGIWGKYGTRSIAADAYWRQPIDWDREAERSGERHRVFCASLADVFEGNDTMPEAAHFDVYIARTRLAALIRDTPNLDWMLLTKRPENITSVVSQIYPPAKIDLLALPNVWLGTSVGVTKTKDRIDVLRNIPTASGIHFLSCEPLLEDLGPLDLSGIQLVIAGGESGAGARPMHPEWVRSIRDQCLSICKDCSALTAKYAASSGPGFVDDSTHWASCRRPAFFFKQWGNWWPIGQMPDGVSDSYYDPKYGKPKRPSYDDRPAPKPVQTTVLQLDGTQEFAFPHGSMTCFNVGKHKSGRLLDGREWNETPQIKEQ